MEWWLELNSGSLSCKFFKGICSGNPDNYNFESSINSSGIYHGNPQGHHLHNLPPSCRDRQGLWGILACLPADLMRLDPGGDCGDFIQHPVKIVRKKRTAGNSGRSGEQ